MSHDLSPRQQPGEWLDLVRFDAQGLVPVIVQDIRDHRVLMLAWADRQALAATLASGQGTYFSRSRKAAWVKGATSGHVQQVREIRLDCDGDAVLYLVEQSGCACHVPGRRSCFAHRVAADGSLLVEP